MSKKVVNLLETEEQKVEEDARQNSIFFEMPDEPIPVVLTGCALRVVNFKKGDSKVIDIKFQVDESGRTKIAAIPEFVKVAYRELVLLLRKHNVIIKKLHPVGTRANLRDYEWVNIKPIAVILSPNTFNNKVWIGHITEINLSETDNLLDAEITEEVQ